MYPQPAHYKATKRARVSNKIIENVNKSASPVATPPATSTGPVSKHNSVHQHQNQAPNQQITPAPSLSWTAESSSHQSHDVFMFDESYNPDSSIDGLFDGLGDSDFLNLTTALPVPVEYSDTPSPMKFMDETFIRFNQPMPNFSHSHSNSPDTDNTSNGC